MRLSWLWFKLLAPAILISSCSTTVHDFEACALIPGNNGAVCSYFLEQGGATLTQEQWESLEANWNSQGMAVECVNSQAISDFKREVEQLCTVAPCDYATKKKILSGLGRLGDIGREVTKAWQTAH